MIPVLLEFEDYVNNTLGKGGGSAWNSNDLQNLFIHTKNLAEQKQIVLPKFFDSSRNYIYI